MKPCWRFRRHLFAFVAGELTGPRLQVLRQHLQACLACRRHAGSWQQAAKALQSAVAGELPPAALPPATVVAALAMAARPMPGHGRQTATWLLLAAAGVLLWVATVGMRPPRRSASDQLLPAAAATVGATGQVGVPGGPPPQGWLPPAESWSGRRWQRQTLDETEPGVAFPFWQPLPEQDWALRPRSR